MTLVTIQELVSTYIDLTKNTTEEHNKAGFKKDHLLFFQTSLT